MTTPLVLPLADCSDVRVAGGKAAGLAWLIRHGVRVPPGVCLTTSACQRVRHDPAQIPDVVRSELDAALARLPHAGRWAIRSSAVDEDSATASFAGVHGTFLNVERAGVPDAIASCWATLNSPQAVAYRARLGVGTAGMAVIVQAMVVPKAAGVAFSCDPVTGETRTIIEAVPGLADALVHGAVAPAPLESVLSASEAADLTAQIERIARLYGRPVDVEWALDDLGLWLLQIRPMTTRAERDGELTNATSVWSRANFKETMPDVPSPLSLSYLEEFMEQNMLRHYRAAGCRIPAGLSSFRVYRGRPYINVSLFQSLTIQLGGDAALIGEHMGGASPPPPKGSTRLPWTTLLRGGLRLQGEIWSALWRAPGWFRELHAIGGIGRGESGASPEALFDQLVAWGVRGPDRDLTFAIVSGVSMASYVLELLLKPHLPHWRTALNDATAGQGTIISAAQIQALGELAHTARREPAASSALQAGRFDDPAVAPDGSGTAFQRRFAQFLDDYGHRAVGESDAASARFDERPDYLLGIVAALLREGAATVPQHEPSRAARREAALREIRRALETRPGAWLSFRFWHRVLCRFLALREANRHAIMHYVAAVRRVLLMLGRSYAARGCLERADDLFFLTTQELFGMRANPSAAWRGVIADRRAAAARQAALPAPDVLLPGDRLPEDAAQDRSALQGLAISAGQAEGAVRVVRAPQDYAALRRGEILVAPVIDPGMAPLFALAAGVIVEMGGVLSHGAIIVREHGIPAIANVSGALTQLKTGDWVRLDAARGIVERAD